MRRRSRAPVVVRGQIQERGHVLRRWPEYDYGRPLPRCTAAHIVAHFFQSHANLDDGAERSWMRRSWWVWGRRFLDLLQWVRGWISDKPFGRWYRSWT